LSLSTALAKATHSGGVDFDLGGGSDNLDDELQKS